MSDADNPERPTIPPISGLRPLTDAEVTRLKQLAERGQRAEEAVRQLPHDDPKPPTKKPEQRPVISPDADPHNANWLRILGRKRRRRAVEPEDEDPAMAEIERKLRPPEVHED